MGKVFNLSSQKTDMFGNLIVTSATLIDFQFLVGHKLEDIIPFNKSNDSLKEEGAIILPRDYFLFEGIKDGEIKMKPYEYNPRRIIISTYKNIIVSVDSIG